MARLSTASVAAERRDIGRLAAPAVVFVVTFACFAPTLTNRFVDWDDQLLLVENTAYRGLGWPQIRYAFTSFLTGPYQPLSWLSYSIDWTIWGLDPRGFHLTNLLLHAATAVGFYFLARRLIEKTTEGLSPGVLRFGAVVAALAFAIHPLRTESVAWAAERRDVLSGVLYVLTLLAYLRYVDAAQERGRWYAIALAAYLLCLLAKAMAMTLPAVLLIVDAYPLRRLRGRMVWMEKIPFVLLAGATAVVAIIGQRQGALLQDVAEFGPLHRVATAGYATCFYLWKSLIPLRLMAMYERPARFDPMAVRYSLCVAFVLIVTIVLLVGCRRVPALCAAWAYYLVTLAPVSGLMQSGWQIAADRYTYVPMMGFAVLVGGWLAGRMDRLRQRDRVLSTAVGGAALMVLMIWGALSLEQTRTWRDSESLWGRAMAVDPTCSHAYSNLALRLDGRGDVADAVKLIEKAIELRPDRGVFWQNYGVFLEKLGRTDEALRAHRRGSEVAPNAVEVVTEYAAALLRAQRPDEAEPLFRRALALDPRFTKAQLGLGVLSARRGDVPEAEAHLQRALGSPEIPPEAFLNVSAAWFAGAQTARGIEALRAGLRRFPDSEAIALRLAWVLATHPDGAYRSGAEAVRLAEPAAYRPGERQALAMMTLSAALAESGDLAAAREVLNRLIEGLTRGGRPMDTTLATMRVELEAGRPIRRPP